MVSAESADLRRFDESRIRTAAGLRGMKLYDPDTEECFQHRKHWPSFPVSRNPEVSILITTHDKVGYLFNCLQSLKASCQAYNGKYEIVVVDDGSTARTSKLLSMIRGLRVIALKRNVGFVKANNIGVKSAKGRFVVFLNNDTIVTSGWLEYIMRTFREHTDVGAVGSKLIYPSCALQEAGSITWNDGTGWNYGRFDDLDKSDYQHVREVDYCSAASLAVDRDLIRPTGIFDERFHPGYYEDTDLCFYVRSRGKRVLYQPKSVVIHFEGVSHGRDVTGGIKKFQEINRGKFVRKWEQELRLQHPPEQRNVLRARGRASGRSILVIDHRILEHDTNSGDLRMFHILQILRSLSWNVTFFPANSGSIEPYTEDLRQREIEVICGTDINELLRQRRSYYDSILLSRLAVAKKYFDVVTLWCPQSVLVLDFPDLESVRELTYAKLKGNRRMASAAQITVREELGFARRADLTVTVTDEERGRLLDRDPTLRVEVIPNIHQVYSGGLPFHKRKDLLFVGGFEHPPNVDAVQFLVDEIFPLIRKRLPKVQLLIAGSKMPSEIRNIRAEGVKILGFVRDLQPLLNSCRVFVAPLRYGAGSKGKIGMAMATGVPVVTTAIGAQGIELERDGPLALAEGARQFAEFVECVYTDPNRWRSLARNGKLYSKRCSPVVVKQQIAEIFSRGHAFNLENRLYADINVNLSLKELQEIRASFVYKAFRRIASSIDSIFPEGTSRGRLRLLVTVSLRIISDEGWRSFLKQASEKIRKREFHVIR